MPQITDEERYRADRAHREEVFRATTAFEHAALKPLFLLNGGALVVLLAFLGAALQAGGNEESMSTRINPLVIWAVRLWSGGLFLAGLAAALGYLSQLNFYKQRGCEIRMNWHGNPNESDAANRQSFSALGHRFRIGAHVSGAISLIAFFTGAMFAMGGIGKWVVDP